MATRIEREYRAICAAEGLTLLDVQRRRKHMAFVCSEGTLFTGCTPSDQRHTRNFRALARRLGRQS